jgi:hypothetical protein
MSSQTKLRQPLPNKIEETLSRIFTSHLRCTGNLYTIRQSSIGTVYPVLSFTQCSGSVTFWYGSGSLDPNADPNPDPYRTKTFSDF